MDFKMDATVSCKAWGATHSSLNMEPIRFFTAAYVAGMKSRARDDMKEVTHRVTREWRQCLTVKSAWDTQSRPSPFKRSNSQSLRQNREHEGNTSSMVQLNQAWGPSWENLRLGASAKESNHNQGWNVTLGHILFILILRLNVSEWMNHKKLVELPRI